MPLRSLRENGNQERAREENINVCHFAQSNNKAERTIIYKTDDHSHNSTTPKPPFNCLIHIYIYIYEVLQCAIVFFCFSTRVPFQFNGSSFFVALFLNYPHTRYSVNVNFLLVSPPLLPILHTCEQQQ